MRPALARHPGQVVEGSNRHEHLGRPSDHLLRTYDLSLDAQSLRTRLHRGSLDQTDQLDHPGALEATARTPSLSKPLAVIAGPRVQPNHITAGHPQPFL